MRAEATSVAQRSGQLGAKNVAAAFDDDCHGVWAGAGAPLSQDWAVVHVPGVVGASHDSISWRRAAHLDRRKFCSTAKLVVRRLGCSSDDALGENGDWISRASSKKKKRAVAKKKNGPESRDAALTMAKHS